MNRRTFCASALAVGMAGPNRVFAASPALPRGHHAKAQLALSTYPFRGHMDAPANNRRDSALPAMNVEQFAQFAQDRFGLGAIEVLDKHFQSTEASYILELRGKLARQRVSLVNIAFDNKAQLCSTETEQRDAGMALHRKWTDLAVALGCPSVRMRMPVGNDPKVLDSECAATALKQLAAYARGRGILLSLENDSPYTESPAQLTAMIKAVHSTNLHVLPDMGNGLASGGEAENARGLEELFRYAYNIAHAKDWEMIAGVRKSIQLQPVVDIARRSRFRGWYSLESDAREDPAADTERLMHSMIECMRALPARSIAK